MKHFYLSEIEEIDMSRALPQVEAVRRIATQPYQIKMYIQEILGKISFDITEAAKANKDSIEIRIPTEFGVAGMTNKTAQLYIYAGLINDLEQRGYKVEINEATRVWRIWGWNPLADPDIEKELLEVIASRTIRGKSKHG